MIGIDTNILLRYFTKDDEAQFEVAREILEDRLSAGDPGYITLIVTVELVWALKHVYKYPADKIVALLRALLDADELEFERSDLVAEAIDHAVMNQIELAEALIALKNLEAGCSSTLTLNKKFAKSVAVTLVP